MFKDYPNRSCGTILPNPCALISMVTEFAGINVHRVCNTHTPPPHSLSVGKMKQEILSVLNELSDLTLDWTTHFGLSQVKQAAEKLIPGITLPLTALQAYKAFEHVINGNINRALQLIPLTQLMPQDLLTCIANTLSEHVPFFITDGEEHHEILLGVAVCALIYKWHNHGPRKQPESDVSRKIISMFSLLRTMITLRGGLKSILSHRTAVSLTDDSWTPPHEWQRTDFQPLPMAPNILRASSTTTEPGFTFPMRYDGMLPDRLLPIPAHTTALPGQEVREVSKVLTAYTGGASNHVTQKQLASFQPDLEQPTDFASLDRLTACRTKHFPSGNLVFPPFTVKNSEDAQSADNLLKKDEASTTSGSPETVSSAEISLLAGTFALSAPHISCQSAIQRVILAGTAVLSALKNSVVAHPVAIVGALGTAGIIGWKAFDYVSAPVNNETNDAPADDISDSPLINLLAHTTHRITHHGGIQTTLDVISMLLEKHGPDEHNPALVRAVMEILTDDGVLHASEMLVRPISLPSGSYDLRPDIQPHSIHKRDVMATVASVEEPDELQSALVESLIAQVTARGVNGPDQQSEHFLFTALQETWQHHPELAWLSRAPVEKQKNWLRLAANYIYASLDLNCFLSPYIHSFTTQLAERLSFQGMNMNLDSITLTGQRRYCFNNFSVSVPVNQTLREWALTRDLHWLESDDVAFLNTTQSDSDGNSIRLSLADKNILLSHIRTTVGNLKTPADLKHDDGLLRQEFEQRTLRAHFDLSALTADLQGTLTGGRNAFLKGLDIVNAAKAGDHGIQTGTLSFNHNSVVVAIPNWLVMLKKDDQGKDDGVVLYSTPGNWSFFNNQTEMQQYLDLRRLAQHVLSNEAHQAKLALPAFSLQNTVMTYSSGRDRAVLAQYFSQLSQRPDMWEDSKLTFSPYEGHDFSQHLNQFSNHLFTHLSGVFTHSVEVTSLYEKSRLLNNEYQMLTRKLLPTLSEFARQQVSNDMAATLVSKNLVTDIAEVDADTIEVSFNGVTGTLTEWALSLYRQHGDGFWHSADFKTEAIFISTTGQDLSKIQQDQSVKTYIEMYLRRAYPADRYIKKISALLQANDEMSRRFRALREALDITTIQLALAEGKAKGYLTPNEHQRLLPLVAGLPQKVQTDDGLVSLGYFGIDGIRIPGMYIIKLASRLGPPRRTHTVSEYVYMPEAPYGQSLYRKAEFMTLLQSSYSIRDTIRERALIKDKKSVDNALRTVQSRQFKVDFMTITNFSSACKQQLRDIISDADERTTSRIEVIQEQVLKGARYITAGVCLAGGPAAAAACATGTAGLFVHDISDIARQVKRGHSDTAVSEALLLGLDVIDISVGLKSFPRSIKALLRKSGEFVVHSSEEARNVLQTVSLRQRSFMPDGHLNPEFSVINVIPDELTETKPRQQLAGSFFYKDDKYFIKDNFRLYEVYSDSGWSADSIRLRYPEYPSRQGPLIIYKDGQWRANQAGLKGGGPVLSYFFKSEHQQTDADFYLMMTAFGKGVPDIEIQVRETSMTLHHLEKKYIIDEVANEIGTDIVNFRRIFSDLKRGTFNGGIKEMQIMNKVSKNLGKRVQLWEMVARIRNRVLEQTADFHFEHEESEKIYHLLLRWLKNNNDEIIPVEFIILDDPYTESKKIIFCLKDKKQKLERLRILYTKYDLESFSWAVNECLKKEGMASFMKKIPDSQNPLSAALDRIKELNLSDEFRANYMGKLKETLNKNNFNLQNEINKSHFASMLFLKEKITNPAMVVKEAEINEFENTLSFFSTDNEIEVISKTRTNRKQKISNNPAAQPEMVEAAGEETVINKYTVKIGPVAEAQMLMEDFPEAAMKKVNEIIEDIEAGRISRKNIGGNVYLDLTQLGDGGRGPWRAAFKRERNTYILLGFFDYHNNKNIAWGLGKMIIG